MDLTSQYIGAIFRFAIPIKSKGETIDFPGEFQTYPCLIIRIYARTAMMDGKIDSFLQALYGKEAIN